MRTLVAALLSLVAAYSQDVPTGDRAKNDSLQDACSFRSALPAFGVSVQYHSGHRSDQLSGS
jgi:hypothetical protein